LIASPILFSISTLGVYSWSRSFLCDYQVVVPLGRQCGSSNNKGTHMNAYPSTIGLTFGDVLAHKAANAYTPARRPKDYKPEFVVRARGRYQGTYNSLKEAQEAACWYAFKNKLHSSDVSVYITRLDEYDHIWEERV